MKMDPSGIGTIESLTQQSSGPLLLIQNCALSVRSVGLAVGLLASLSVARVQAQSQPPQYVTKYWRTEQGLPQNSVNAMVQDHRGYLWIGTFGGLARFDGERFTVFDSADTPGFGSDRIFCLNESRSGVLWIGTVDGGLIRFDDGVATTYTEHDGLPSGSISSIRHDTEGDVWINTSRGIARFAGTKVELYATYRGKAVREFFLQARDGSMWFRSGQDVLRFGADGSVATLTVLKPSVFFLHETRDGSVWIAFRDQYRLVRYDRGTFSDVRLPPIGKSTVYAGQGVPAMAEDTDGALLLATPAGLVRVVDGRASSPEALPLPASGRELPKVRSLLVDREGNRWVGTIGSGLVRLRRAPLTAYGKDESLSDSSFSAVFQDREGRTWLGGDELYWFDGRRFHLFPGVVNNLTIAQTRDGDLWFGGYGGVHRFSAGVLSYFKVEAPAVRAIYEDRQGTLWIGALTEERPGGLYRFREGKLEQVPGISDVRAIAEDRDGGLWLGGLEGLRYMRGSKTVTYDQKQGLSNKTVYDIHQDSTGTLWVATYGGGLNRLRDGRFKAITTKDGLPNNMLLGILEDAGGNLWLSSNQGICRLSLKELNDFVDGKISSISPVSYGAAEGMRSTESNDGSPAAWKTTDGRIWFPTLRGVVAIDPSVGNRLPPPVVLEEAWANKLTLAPDGQTSIPPGNNTLDFRFTALNFSAPEKLRFRYRLDPFDKDWVDAGTRRTAHYTNMAPGKYSFQVVAANSYGIWDDQGASVRFLLKPHFYQTLWFRLVLLAGVVLLAGSAYWLRVRQLHARAARLKQLADTLQEQANLLNLTHDAIFVMDLEGEIKYWNRGAEERYGWPIEQAIGKDVHHLLKTVFPAPFEQIKEEVVLTGRWEGELVHTKKDGTQVVVASRWSLQRDERGAPIAILETNNDITERKRAEEAFRLSNAYNRSLIEASLDPLVTIRPDGKITDVNAATEAATGRSRGELIDTDFCDYFTEPGKARAGYQQVFREGMVRDYPLELQHRDGGVTSVLYNASVYRDQSGQVIGVFAAARDITERKQAEQTLRQSEAYRAEAESLTHAGSWAFDLASNKYVYVSEEDFRIWGFDAQEGLPTGEAVFRRIHPEDRNRWKANFERALREKVDSFDDYRVVLPDGTVKHIHTIRHPVLNDAGDLVKLVGTSMDITERKRAEEALRQSEAHLAEAQRLSHAGSWAWNPATRESLYWSEEMFRIFGLNPQEDVPTTETYWQRIHPEDLDRTRELLLKVAAGNTDYEHDHRIVLPDGSVKHIHAIGHPVLDENGQVAQYVGTAVDVTERKRAEEALRESETLFRTFVDHAADAFFVLDIEQGKITDVNREACESLGYTRQELIGMTPLAFDRNVGLAVTESVAERTAAGETVFDTHWHQGKNGTLFPVEAHTSQFWYAGRRFLLKVARDISDRVRAEEQREELRQLEADLAHINRVSMMGELTASTAHEVNQPLSGVVSNGSACLRWLAGEAPNVEEAREAARRIVRDGKRAGEVIARVRALAKRAATAHEKLDLNETIREVLALVGDEAKRKSVIIRTQFADDLSPMSGDRVQLQQVMLNLTMNAIEAMSSVDERARELVITTRNIEEDQVLVTVKDSGPGIDPNTLDKIFDPFYTTKPGGMGMGLSISRSILQAHGGRLWAAAKDGPGTIFHCSLPKYHAGAADERVAGV